MGTSLLMESKPFLPKFLANNAQGDDFGTFESLATEATVALAKLSGMMCNSQVTDFFWLNWLMREAQISSEIEGTITTLNEILGENVGIRVPLERKDDVLEVMNYREAMLSGMKELQEGRKPGLALIRALHAQLLAGTRGAGKNPGTFRSIQVQIGRPAVYLPPEPLHIAALLENLEVFLARNDINPIVQTAIMHAQFEMIHPFCDGNGRLGRLIIALYLAQRKVIELPCFYMSAYLNEHREKYYELLNRISKAGDWKSWIEFFLRSVVARSENNISLLGKMTDLYERSKTDFSNLTGSSYAREIMDYMFKNPLFTAPDLMKNAGINLKKAAVTAALNRLQAGGIITKIDDKQGRRPAKWAFMELMDLVSQG